MTATLTKVAKVVGITQDMNMVVQELCETQAFLAILKEGRLMVDSTHRTGRKTRWRYYLHLLFLNALCVETPTCTTGGHLHA